MRRRRRQQTIDWLRPLSERDLERRAQHDQSLTVGPLAKQINRRAASGAQNLEGVYSRLAGNLEGYRATQQGIYDRARTNVGAANTQGAAQLAQTGKDVGGALQHQLALSGGTPDMASGGGGYGADLQRMQSGQALRGGAELGELALRQAAAEDFAAKVPGFARLAGAQGIRELQAKRAQDVADLTTRASTGLAQSLASGRRQEYEKAVAARGFGVDYAKLAAADRQNAVKNQQGAAKISIQQQRANEASRHNANMERISAKKGNNSAAVAAETRRHNRVTEKISKRRQKTAKWKAHHPKGAGGGGGGGVGSPP